jgi:UDP-N-acetyl-D-mannosaminuronate dehydrogenase
MSYTRAELKMKKQMQSLFVFELNSILDEDIDDELKQIKILILNIAFKNSENPNDYDASAVKKFIYHFDLLKYSNPTFEGYDEIIIKIYHNYKKQKQDQEQEQIKQNKFNNNVFGAIF